MVFTIALAAETVVMAFAGETDNGADVGDLDVTGALKGMCEISSYINEDLQWIGHDGFLGHDQRGGLKVYVSFDKITGKLRT